MNETTVTVLSVRESARAEIFFDAVEDSATATATIARVRNAKAFAFTQGCQQ